jgi:hypothetical protein
MLMLDAGPPVAVSLRWSYRDPLAEVPDMIKV